MVTLDSGFVNTAGCTSAITYIDDDAGVLRYRGYPIGQLAEHSTFLEISPELCRSARCAACRGVPGQAATSLSSQKVHSGRSLVRHNGRTVVKDTKTHQMRRISLDDATVQILGAHRQRCAARCTGIGTVLGDEAFVFSYSPDNRHPCSPSAITHRYARMTTRLGYRTHLHALRHYSATELLAAGVDLSTVAGRLGHGGGGSTTLKVYAAWVAGADKKAAHLIACQLPRPQQIHHEHG